MMTTSSNEIPTTVQERMDMQDEARIKIQEARINSKLFQRNETYIPLN
jgi:hypothetical protein